ncbi:MAG: tetratricopeptide repeat protein, partial [Cyanobacteria bacterium J06628_6]
MPMWFNPLWIGMRLLRIGVWIAMVASVLMLNLSINVQSAWTSESESAGGQVPGWTVLEQQLAAISANPENPTAWNNLGQSLFSLGQISEALLAYNHALMISPDYSLVLANRCGVLSQLEEYQLALQSCDLALQVNHQWGAQGAALAWDNRGDVLFRLEDYQASLRSFEQALTVNPNYQNAWRNREVVLSQLAKMQSYPSD